MKLNDRMTQLAKYGIDFNTKPVDISKLKFSGPIVARFESGEGLEYIPIPTEHYAAFPFMKERGNRRYQLLLDEFGEEFVGTVAIRVYDVNYAIKRTEEHVIVDFPAGMEYRFFLPSRDLENRI